MTALVRRWVPWVLQMVAVSGASACGALSGEPSDHEGTGGRLATGGATLTGGQGTTSGGAGAVAGTGGTGAVGGAGGGWGVGTTGGTTSGVLPASIRCGEIPEGQIEPPCTADDLVAGSNCASDLPFSLPLETLKLPAATPLSLALLARESGMGAAGSGATPTPLPPLTLEARDYPDDASFGWGPEFTVSASTTDVIGRVPFAFTGEPTQPGYLTEIAAINGSGDMYFLGEVGVFSGEEMLSKLRLIIEPSFVCLVK